MLRKTLVAAAVLSIGTYAHAAMLIDFGSDPGQYQQGSPGLIIQDGYGSMTRERAFTPDTMTLAYTASGAWQNWGEQFRGTMFQAMDVSSWGPDDQLAITARFINGATPPDFYRLMITLYAVDGSTSAYQFFPGVQTTPAPFDYGTDPSSVTFTTVTALSTLGNPASVSATNGAFDFANDVLDGFDLLLQVGFNAGSTTLEVDRIEIIAVPEPTAMAALGTLSLITLRRRRA